MRPRRVFAAFLVFVLVCGLVGGTLAYGLYHQSQRYRAAVEDDLSTFFGLPTTIADIEPHTFTSRRLMDVRMWLPERRSQIFEGPQVIWQEDQESAEGGVRIDIYDADLTIDSVAWEREDYARVLRASLAHNFGQLDIREVRYHNARIVWARPDVSLVAEGVEGIIHFEPDGRGKGHLTCHRLNGASVTEPIQITASIDPHTSELLPEVILDVPRLPLKDLDLNALLASEITQGTFEGKVHLRQSEGVAEVELSGSVSEVRLDEFTRRVPHGPYPATVDLTIKQAVLRETDIVTLKFDGEVREIDMDPILSRWGLPEIGGSAWLTIHNARFADNKLIWLLAEGEWTGASMEHVAEMLFDRGGVNGKLRVTVNNLMLNESGIASGDVDVVARPEPGKRGRIDRMLLADVLEKSLNVSLPEMMMRLFPESIEYVQIGAHLLLESGQIRVFAAEGPAGRSIITARIQNQDLPLLGDMDAKIPMQRWIQRFKDRVNALESEWRQRLGRPKP